MKVKELREMLEDVDGDVDVAVWCWFAAGERVYKIELPLDSPRFHRGYLLIGCFDDCVAHRVMPADVVRRFGSREA